MNAYSEDLRERIVARYERGDVSQAELAEEFSVCPRTVANYLRLKRTTGSVAAKPHRGGPPPSMGEAEERRLRELLKAQPDLTLGALRSKLGDRFGVVTIHRTLKRMKARYKKNAARQ
jgi:transposase